MDNVIQFPTQTGAQIDALQESVETLLAEYSAEQIILALFSKATEQVDVDALQPSVFKILREYDK